MKTITLTDSEIETLRLYLQCNPCTSTCLFNYSRIGCDSVNEQGVYACKLKRNTESIIEKLGGW